MNYIKYIGMENKTDILELISNLMETIQKQPELFNNGIEKELSSILKHIGTYILTH